MLLGLYRVATDLGAPWLNLLLHRRARRGKEDPARLAERYGHASLPRPDGKLVWLHGASVGESLAVLPLIDLILERRRDIQVLVTTGTVTSARLMAERLPERARHQFAPVDRRSAWRRFLEHWRPDLAVLVESELWPNLFATLEERATPVALINGRMSPRSFARWQRLPGTARRLLGALELCLAQSEDDGARLRELGARRVEVVGNLKLAAPPLAADRAALAELGEAIGTRPVWLAASTHPGEEGLALQAHRTLARQHPELLLIIVPRHPERGPAVTAEMRAGGMTVHRRAAGETVSTATSVYVADTLGELGLFYRLAPIALIGGSLVPHGGQNPLEAARLGCVPILGPHTLNFAEITRQLVARAAAIPVADLGELVLTVGELLADPDRCRAYAERARDAARAQADVLERTYRALGGLLGPADAQP